MTLKRKPLTLSTIATDIGNLCLYVFLIMTTLIFMYRYDHTMFIIRYVFLICGALIGYGKCIWGKRKNRYPILLMIVFFFLWIMASIGQNGYQNYAAVDFLYTFCYIGLSVVILENQYSHRVSLILYGFTSISFLLRVLQETNKNQLLLANSRNYISVLLLSTMLLYYISCYDKKKPVLITPVLLFFYINIYATGRSGILVSGFLTIGLLAYKYVNIKSVTAKRLLGLLIVIVLGTIVFFIVRSSNTLIPRIIEKNFSSFAKKGIDSNGRIQIWKTFFQNNNRSILGILFGSDATLAMNEGNLHNSYIQSYASFGLIGFLTIVVLLIRTLSQGIKNRDNLFLILLGGLLLRAFTDRVFFQGYCEIFLWYFILYWDHKKWQLKNKIG